MKKVILLYWILFGITPLFSQNSTLKLLNGFEYKLDNKRMEVEANKTINAPYHFEYQLQDKNQVSKLRIRINSMDYHLKDSVYSDLEIQKRTALGELERLKKELSKLTTENKNLLITYFNPPNYKNFKLLTVIMKMKNIQTRSGIL